MLSNEIVASLFSPKDKVSKSLLCSTLEGILIPSDKLTRSTTSQKARGPGLCEKQGSQFIKAEGNGNLRDFCCHTGEIINPPSQTHSIFFLTKKYSAGGRCVLEVFKIPAKKNRHMNFKEAAQPKGFMNFTLSRKINLLIILRLK